MNKKRGISIITLVITIVVILILSSGVVITVLQDNLIKNANNTSETNNKEVAEEEVELVVNDLIFAESQKRMRQTEKRDKLETNLRNYDSNSTVEIDGNRFIAIHRGYYFEISDAYRVVGKGKIDSNDWDALATPDDLFIWDEVGTTIIGYKEQLSTYEKIRIPSKCIAIKPTDVWQGNVSRSNIVGGIKKVEIPETVTEIGNCAFADFRNLTQINIPNKVTSIGTYAFSNCYKLTNIVLPEGLINIGDSAFIYCTTLESITIPSSVENIGKSAFLGCGLKNVNIPEGITCIDSSVFDYCLNLESVTLPSTLTEIGRNAFDECKNLKSIKIPESVTSIGNQAFRNCKSLTSIVIPKGVETMGQYVFIRSQENNGITVNIYCEAESKPEGWNDEWDSISWGTNNVIWGYTGE